MAHLLVLTCVHVHSTWHTVGAWPGATVTGPACPVRLGAQEPAYWLLISQLCEKTLPLWTDGGAGAEVPTMFLESLLRDHSALPSLCPHPSPSSSSEVSAFNIICLISLGIFFCSLPTVSYKI